MTPKLFRFNVGDRLQDRVTGLLGICIGRCEHISGCDTYGLQPETLKDGLPVESKWLDDPRLELVAANVLKAFDTRDVKTGADSIPQATR